MSTKRPTLIDDEGNETALPFKWTICSACQGNGKSSAYLGAFTRDDIDQQEPGFLEDYMAGFYDRTCEACEGAGKVAVVDFNKLTKEQKRAWNEQVRDEREYQAECRMERMMGA